jgi:serine/threonine protein kinase
MTKTGTQMGTAFYMSPEQVLNRGADIRSDIYSLGVTLYEMLTANVPFNGDSDYQVMTDHVNSAPPLPTKFYPYIPQGLQNAVLKALEKKPDARFQTVEEFGAALEQPDTFNVAPPPVIAPPPVVPAPRAATRVESATAPLPVPVAPIVVAGPAKAAAAPPAAPDAGASDATPPPMPSKASFWTPERKIAGGGVAAILLLIGLWAALRPNVKNTGLPPAPVSVNPTPSTPPPQEDQTPAPQQQPPVPNQPAKKTPPNTTPPNNSAANNSIPPLPPVQPEQPTPSKQVPAQPSFVKIPAGTIVTIRLIENIDSRLAQTGQRFQASVDLPVVVGGRTAIAQGAGARVVLNNFGNQVRLELVSISANGINHIVRSNLFEKQGMIRGKPSPFVIVPPDTRIRFTLLTPIS